MIRKFPTSPSKINGAFVDANGSVYLVGPSNLIWKYESDENKYNLETCYPKKITQSLLSCR